MGLGISYIILMKRFGGLHRHYNPVLALILAPLDFGGHLFGLISVLIDGSWDPKPPNLMMYDYLPQLWGAGQTRQPQALTRVKKALK